METPFWGSSGAETSGGGRGKVPALLFHFIVLIPRQCQIFLYCSPFGTFNDNCKHVINIFLRITLRNQWGIPVCSSLMPVLNLRQNTVSSIHLYSLLCVASSRTLMVKRHGFPVRVFSFHAGLCPLYLMAPHKVSHGSGTWRFNIFQILYSKVLYVLRG